MTKLNKIVELLLTLPTILQYFNNFAIQPSFQEKYVTVLTAVERRSEQTYTKLLNKKE